MESGAELGNAEDKLILKCHGKHEAGGGYEPIDEQNNERDAKQESAWYRPSRCSTRHLTIIQITFEYI